MTAIRDEIRFLLNDREERLTAVRSSDTLLDHLRLTRRLRGTKEGCAEGDCGACTVLVGRRTGGGLVYEPVNACIRLMGSLDLCHVVTVEHLAGADGALHPVQQAMVDTHGSQCGFCTPGFVMSLYGLWMRDAGAGRGGDRGGAAGQSLPLHRLRSRSSRRRSRPWRYGSPQATRWSVERERVLERLARAGRRRARRHRDRAATGWSCRRRRRLRRRCSTSMPEATIVAGSTDVGLWITKFMRDISPAVFIAHLDELRRIERTAERRDARRGRQLRRLPGDARRRVPAPLRVLAPHRRLAGARDGHRRRQHRQRLADRRHAAGADRARRDGDAAQGRRRGGRCRSRTSSSPTASRTASRASSSRRSSCRGRRRAR